VITKRKLKHEDEVCLTNAERGGKKYETNIKFISIVLTARNSEVTVSAVRMMVAYSVTQVVFTAHGTLECLRTWPKITISIYDFGDKTLFDFPA
jgi:hypothetical protein